jgi:hypothetical protein
MSLASFYGTSAVPTQDAPSDAVSPPEDDQPLRRKRIGEVLVSQGLLDDEQLQQALAAQRDVPPTGRASGSARSSSPWAWRPRSRSPRRWRRR